jgi:hypothetical protein
VIAPEVAALIVAWWRAGESPSPIGQRLHMTLSEVSSVLRATGHRAEPVEVGRRVLCVLQDA